MQLTVPIGANARCHGDRTALICGDVEMNWREVSDQVARFAAVVREQGVAAGDRVAILAENSELYFSAFFAVPWAGAILLPLNTRLTAPELAELIAAGSPSLILFDEINEAALRQAISRLPIAPRTLALRAGDQSLAARLLNAAPIGDANRRGDDPAAIFYTGGTTGRSKGAITTSHTHIYNSLGMWTHLGVDMHDARYLHAPPMFHVADALFVHAMTLVGASHVVLPRFQARSFIDAVAKYEISDVFLVATMVTAVLDELDLSPRDLPSLKRIFYGAMPMPEATARRLIQALPAVGLIQLYGQSESGPVLTMLRPQEHDVSTRTSHLRSAGQPVPGVDLAIVDETGKPLPSGEVGEIVARAGVVMPGYWNDPVASAAALRGGWLHTGDAGYIADDGFLYVVDRIKDMIISGGENIYSIEVERAIMLHPAVAQCAVIGVPDPAWGERVHAAVVLRAGTQLTADGLRDHCREHIASYKLPRSVDWRSSLPLSGPGKILKRALREEANGAV